MKCFAALCVTSAVAAASPDIQAAVHDRLSNVNITEKVEQGLWTQPRSYKPYRYEEITKLLNDTASAFPNLIKVYTAQEAFAADGVNLDADFFYCSNNEKCATHIVEIGNRNVPDWRYLPETFISGAVHGDERVGPTVSVELMLLLTELYGTNPVVTYLMNTRKLIMMPMTNAYGYAHNTRAENHIDPNRDFGYGSDSDSCMQTITARAVNELFRRHLFQTAITFHGGTRVLSYEWGSFDHAKQIPPTGSGMRPDGGYASQEPPDAASQNSISTSLQEAAGLLNRKNHPFERFEDYGYRRLHSIRAQQTPQRRRLADVGAATDMESFYPMGPMSDMVYPVNGGFEDWSYSASWAGSPPITICTPKTYGGYPEQRTTQYNDTVRCSTFLVETDYFKNPPFWQWGHSLEVFSRGELDGHVSRNMRLSLKLMELTQPDLLLASPPALDDSGRLSLQLLAVGCTTLDELEAVIIDGPCDRFNATQLTQEELNSEPTLRVVRDLLPQSPTNCTEVNLWEWPATNGFNVAMDVPEHGCVWLRAAFDQHWGKQNNPEPKLPPQTHVARRRLEPVYTAEAAEASIRAHRMELFPRRLGWGAAYLGGMDVRVVQAQQQQQQQQQQTEQQAAADSWSQERVAIVDFLAVAPGRTVWKVGLFASDPTPAIPRKPLPYTATTAFDPLQQHDWLTYSADDIPSKTSAVPPLQPLTTKESRQLQGDAAVALTMVALTGELPADAGWITLRLLHDAHLVSPGCAVSVASLALGAESKCGDGILLEVEMDKESGAVNVISPVGQSAQGNNNVDLQPSTFDPTTRAFEVYVDLSDSGLQLKDLGSRLFVVEFRARANDAPVWMSFATAQWKGGPLDPHHDARCVFTPASALVINDDNRYGAKWFRNPRQRVQLAQDVSRHALGTLELRSDGTLDFRACNVASPTPSSLDVLRVAAAEGDVERCTINITAKRNEEHFLSPAASRMFSFQAKSSAARCDVGSTLVLTLQQADAAAPVALAQCQVHTAQASRGSPPVCGAESVLPVGAEETRKVPVAALAVGGVLSSVAIKLWCQRRQGGYVTAPSLLG